MPCECIYILEGGFGTLHTQKLGRNPRNQLASMVKKGATLQWRFGEDGREISPSLQNGYGYLEAQQDTHCQYRHSQVSSKA
jgi:hypothetical protein